MAPTLAIRPNVVDWGEFPTPAVAAAIPACVGVWWVTHRNEQGVVTAQFIEVAFVPELVKAHQRSRLKPLLPVTAAEGLWERVYSRLVHEHNLFG